LTFCTLEIEYLGYTLTRDGIKPQSKKVQAVLAIQLPTNIKQLRHFLGMVQYYRDLWARRSNVLAPLTSLVGECGQTNVTRAKGTKKVLLKSLGIPTPRNPHYHILGTSIILQSPQAFLTTKYLAIQESSIGYQLLTTILEEHQ
jgi:hypothetical protein